MSARPLSGQKTKKNISRPLPRTKNGRVRIRLHSDLRARTAVGHDAGVAVQSHPHAGRRQRELRVRGVVFVDGGAMGEHDQERDHRGQYHQSY